MQDPLAVQQWQIAGCRRVRQLRSPTSIVIFDWTPRRHREPYVNVKLSRSLVEVPLVLHARSM
jgi:hypothetical protein